MFSYAGKVIQNLQLISALSISPLQTYTPGLLALLAENLASTQREESYSQYVLKNKAANAVHLYKASENGMPVSVSELAEEDEVIALMQFKGIGTPEGYDGVPGYLQMMETINLFKNSKQIKALIISVESPGGSVYRLNELKDTVADFGKPTIGFVNGMAYSMGYGLVSSCPQIVANHRNAGVGSIGTAVSYWDLMGILENFGAKYHYVNAPENPDKNKSFTDLKKGDYEAIQSELSEDSKEFHNQVRKSRPHVLEEHLTGKVFNAANVMPALVDAISPLHQLITNSLSITKTQKSND